MTRRPARTRAEVPPAPTMPCPACQGTGLDRGRAFTHANSRASLDQGAVADQVRCPACEGRGRQTIARVLLDRST
jgi:DnaJ-class molecular chaperone